jgi:hypothetical protein
MTLESYRGSMCWHILRNNRSYSYMTGFRSNDIEAFWIWGIRRGIELGWESSFCCLG